MDCETLAYPREGETMPNKKIARWESRSGKHWIDLFQVELGYRYTSPSAGGLFNADSTEQAISKMQRRVDSGYFQPDANITPMRRVL